MVDPTTPNLVLAQPLRGSDVGTWDTPVNNNTGVIDSAFGGITTLALSSADVTLLSSQAQSAVIRLTGTISINAAIVLPSIYKGWTIDNQLTNSPSSFSARILSTAGTFVLGLAPGVNDIFYDSSSIRYRNMGKVGEYWDYAGTTIPTWVSLCTIPPWLNCTGGPFSSSAYPILANLLGTTTLPDARGRSRFTLNQTTGRISAGSGINGDVIGSGGGADTVTLATSQIPSHTHANSLSDPGHTHSAFHISGTLAGGTADVTVGAGTHVINDATFSSVTNITLTNAAAGGSGPFINMAPSYMGGITMIRAG